MRPNHSTIRRAISRSVLALASAAHTPRLLPALAAALLACGGDGNGSTGPDQPGTSPVATVVVQPTTGALTVGQTVALTVVLRDAAGRPLDGRAVAWRSSDEAIATVSSAGLVAARTAGSAVITATSEGKSGQTGVVVSAVPVAYVQITPAALSLLPNETGQLQAMARDADGGELPGHAIVWQSNDPAIATVTEGGLVTARGVGVTRISAASGGRSGFAEVEVRPLPPAPVARVVLGGATLGLEPNETRLIAVRVEDAAGQPLPGRLVTWGSSNPNVALVDQDGRVNAIQVGDAVITATSEGKSAQVAVNVATAPAFGLLYDRVAASGNEIFYLDLLGGGPQRLNAGNVSRQPSPSPDGSRFVFAVSQRDLTSGEMMYDLYVVDRTGLNIRRLTRMAGVETDPAWSPDGTKIAFAGSETANGSYDIYVMNADGTNVVNITADMPWSYESNPAWSPDGRYIAFSSLELIGGMHVFTRRSDGSGDPSRVAGATGTSDSHPTWSPDGLKLAFSRTFAGGESDIMTMTFNGNDVTRIVAPGEQVEPVWSPDGRFFAFSGRVNGVSQIFTMRVDGSAVRLRTSETSWGGGRNPVWVTR